MTSTTATTKEEKKLAFPADTFVSQYGSHFSNPKISEIRRMQTPRQPTQNMRTGKTSAAEALNTAISERKIVERTEIKAKDPVLGDTSPNPSTTVFNKIVTTSLGAEVRGETTTILATTKAWDYVQAMTHPNTPLLLLSPLPITEDSPLFLIDQHASKEDAQAAVLTQDFAKGNKRQRDAATEKTEQPRPAKKQKKMSPVLGQLNEATQDTSEAVICSQPEDSHSDVSSFKASVNTESILSQYNYVQGEKSVSEEGKGKRRDMRDEKSKNQGKEGISRSRSTSLSPHRTSGDSDNHIKGATMKHDDKTAESVYSNSGDKCKYDTKEQGVKADNAVGVMERTDVSSKEKVVKKSRDRERSKEKKEKEKSKETRSDSKARRKGKPDVKEKIPKGAASRKRETEGHSVGSGKLKEEATKLKHLADNVFKNSKAEGLNYYIFAGLKFLECCQQLEKEADSKPEALKSAFVMYKETAKFLENCGAMCVSNKEQARASLCYKCMAVALARAFNMQKEKLKRVRDELWGQLNKSSHSSPPVPGHSASAGRASSMSPSPTYKSIPSPLSGGSAPTQPPGLLQKELSFLSEIDDVFKALDAWHKADNLCGGPLAELLVPFTLDNFLASGEPPVHAVIDYVHKALELL